MPLVRLPLPDPGSPDLRSPGRFLAWLARSQRRGQWMSMLWGTLFLACRSAVPFCIGAGIQAVVEHRRGELWAAGAVALALGVVQTVAGSIDPGFQVLAGHLAFLCVLAIKPSGLFGSPA